MGGTGIVLFPFNRWEKRGYIVLAKVLQLIHGRARPWLKPTALKGQRPCCDLGVSSPPGAARGPRGIPELHWPRGQVR